MVEQAGILDTCPQSFLCKLPGRVSMSEATLTQKKNTPTRESMELPAHRTGSERSSSNAAFAGT